MIDPNENDIDYKALEGKLDVANVLASLLQSLGGSAEIPADMLFTNIQVDRTLILDYNEEKKNYTVSIQVHGKDEVREAAIEEEQIKNER